LSAFEKASKYSRKLNLDECEIISTLRKIITVRITDSEIFELKQNFEKSFGVRIINDKKISSFQTNNENEISHEIEKGIKNLSCLKRREFWKGLPSELKQVKQIPETYDKNIEEISETKSIDLAQQMINSASDKKIKTISGSLNIVSESFEIGNSNGLSLTDKGTYVSGIINTDPTDDSEVSGLGHGCSRTLEGFFPQKIGEESKIMCLESINPKKCESGKFSIIFDPYSVGEILAFVVASNFHLKTFSEKKSCFSEKLNQNIAVENFTLIDNPHASQGIGSKSFDDEGVQTRVAKLVDKGKFANTYSNLFDSFKEGSESTGNASRPGSPMGRSSEPIPISAPHNLEIQTGNISKDEMIKDTRRGLIIGRLWYTYAVNPLKGDFSCTARSGISIIENGKIINPGKPVRIIHNLQKLFAEISAIGNDKKNVIQWASFPSITPTIKVEQISVSSI